MPTPGRERRRIAVRARPCRDVSSAKAADGCASCRDRRVGHGVGDDHQRGGNALTDPKNFPDIGGGLWWAVQTVGIRFSIEAGLTDLRGRQRDARQ